MSSNQQKHPSGPGICLVDELMQKVSHELAMTARACSEIQWLISSLLERAHHPDLPAEMHMLQDIDRMQQTLKDIASLLEATSILTKGLRVASSDLAPSLKLESLRARLFGESPQSDPATPSASNDADITWL